jgi:flagellar biosynthesis anti-sigma factor FlgM
MHTMVESIKPHSANQAQLTRDTRAAPRNDLNSAAEQKVPASSSVKPETVSVELESAVSAQKLAEAPPVDIELVKQIRQRVAEGQYPIDAAAIADKMFASIKDG